MKVKVSRLERIISTLVIFQITGMSYIYLWIAMPLEQFPMALSGDPPATSANYDTHPPLNISQVPWLSTKTLPRAVTRVQHDKMMDLLQTLTGLLEKANITYIMCDGTLLGSYINHDILPWDDDLDLMVSFNDLPKIKQMLKQKSIWKLYTITDYPKTGREYEFNIIKNLPPDLNDPMYYYVNSTGLKKINKSYHKFKFFENNSKKIRRKLFWKWPFIDVKYYMENDSHIWNLDKEDRVFYTERENFYPLHLRPFGSLWLPAPHDTRNYLISKYGHFQCARSVWNHKKEAIQHIKSTPCEGLSRYYPFVWRERSDRGVLEVLKVDDTVIQQVHIPERFNISQTPFAL